MSAARRVRPCGSRDWPALYQSLEVEFLHSRGRTGSLSRRYPALFERPDAATAFRCCEADGALVGACALRRFSWHAERVFEGAMIGFVWTDPGRRGEGHAAFLLRAVVEELAARGLDFVVLWSGLEGFYERLGWQRADPGVFASVPGNPNGTREALEPLVPALLEGMRLAADQPRLLRTGEDWRAVPIPATTTGVIATDSAYVLCGELDAARYVYEAHGSDAALAALWPRVVAGVSQVHVNDWTGGTLHGWLARQPGVRVKPQGLAFWQLLGTRARHADWRRWHLPWFDRI